MIIDKNYTILIDEYLNPLERNTFLKEYFLSKKINFLTESTTQKILYHINKFLSNDKKLLLIVNSNTLKEIILKFQLNKIFKDFVDNKKINDENDKDNIYGLRYQLKKMKNSDVYKTYLLTKDKYGDDLSKFYYFDLNTMKPVYIDGVNVKALNNINEYKYFCVDETGNLVKTHTANLLVDFTKIYSYNINHSTSLIYNILFANKNKDKISL